jgi:hypothetical protein
MLTPEEHTTLLEAKKTHGGHSTIFLFNAGYKVAFGTPEINPPGCRQQGYAQLWEMSHAPTLKEAIIAALVCGKTFYDYFDGDPEAWWRAQLDSLNSDPNMRTLLTLCEAIAIKNQVSLVPEDTT